MEKLHLEIVTPQKSFFDDEIDMVIVRGSEGDLAILKDRTPIATPLKIGKIRIFKEDMERVASVVDGYITVVDNQATVVTEAAEWPGDIDVQRAKAAKERAEERLQKKESGTDLDRAEYSLKRAINRLDVSKYKK
jgi:F-type H+-transporting ATPase subunit epsilon